MRFVFTNYHVFTLTTLSDGIYTGQRSSGCCKQKSGTSKITYSNLLRSKRVQKVENVTHCVRTKMGAVEGFKGAGLFVKIAFVLLLLAALFSWISFTNTGWGRTDTGVSNSDTFIGLWRRCTNSKQVTGCSQLDGIALGKTRFSTLL